jgi:hypothetical protein
MDLQIPRLRYRRTPGRLKLSEVFFSLQLRKKSIKNMVLSICHPAMFLVLNPAMTHIARTTTSHDSIKS